MAAALQKATIMLEVLHGGIPGDGSFDLGGSGGKMPMVQTAWQRHWKSSKMPHPTASRQNACTHAMGENLKCKG